MNNTLIIFTANFPYCPGEEFIESEINYITKKIFNYNICIIPTSFEDLEKKEKRLIDEKKIKINLIIYTCLKNKFKKYTYIIFSIFIMLFESSLYREIKYIIKNKKFSIINLKNIIRSYSLFEIYYILLKRIIINLDDNAILYSYWNTPLTAALLKIKKKHKKNIIVISRIHGYDLYEERIPGNNPYYPLKRIYLNRLDMLITLSEIAKEYVIKKYNVYKFKITSIPLGVYDNNIVCLASENNKFNILTCSSIIPLKRIDKIICAIKILSYYMPNVMIKWIHIGSGEKQYSDYIKNTAINKLNAKNISYEFVGQLSNKEVYEFYKTNRIDVFVNFSLTEGTPVSIIEAMSCHIPIIAPRIGNIEEMIINNYNGILLNKNSDENDLANALLNIEFFKRYEIRENSYYMYRNKYDAAKNYRKFYNLIFSIKV